jgi:hypothetical protein
MMGLAYGQAFPASTDIGQSTRVNPYNFTRFFLN